MINTYYFFLRLFEFHSFTQLVSTRAAEARAALLVSNLRSVFRPYCIKDQCA